jgi:hypothetical protein
MFLILFLNLIFLNADTGIVKEKELSGFKNAISMTTDGKGYIYVLDNETNEIVKINENLDIKKRVGKKGWDAGEFDSPTFIDGSSGLDLYVSDGKNYRIQRFDLNLSYLTSLVTNTITFDDKLKFDRPIASVVVNSSYSYVIDGDNNRIVVYQNGITPLFSFGGFQSAETPFQNPVKILKDGNNYLYIFDKKRNAVVCYDNFGNYIKSFEFNRLISVSIFNNILYFLTDNEILTYDLFKNAYREKVNINKVSNNHRINDFLIYSENKFFILERNVLFFYKFIK